MKTCGSGLSLGLNSANGALRRGLPMKSMAVLMATAGVLVASPASAALLNFDLTGSRQASFQIDTANAPDTSSSSIIGDQIQYFNVVGTFGGVAETATIGFGTYLAASLNIQAAGLGFTQFAGPELFASSATGPQFNLGTFDLTSIVSGSSSITISTASAAPEPTTWAMMVMGFAGLGFMAKRQAKRRLRPA